MHLLGCPFCAKKRETGCGYPVDTSAKQKQRPSRQAVWYASGILSTQWRNTDRSARRGSNPRPPPWQGGAPPLSHSRIAWCVCHTQDIYYYIELCLSTTFFKKHHFFNLTLHLNIFNHLLFNYFPKTIFSCAMSYYSSLLFKFCKNTLCLSLCNINRQCQLFC